MSLPEISVIIRYFEAEAHRNTNALVALFSDEAVVVDESQTYHGPEGIRGWREGAASMYQYTTQVLDTRSLDAKSYLVAGRLTGNFPGGTAELQWRFIINDGLIDRLEIE
ncbi:hypothetical protein KDA_52180 [Dictyobacter alpinus]|uniref:SnoaL-like domain-containing protein n=1 Tax=Dictyobacter alpinus TaxID=2014873 RepID=A0A402BEC6_9CHLR|nr:nuclear transport factor 2 family protein [Dictyobacter alpinus]GCE29734.1 hypothetical protein KDA_52180 [Dictyobacter alpinus]